MRRWLQCLRCGALYSRFLLTPDDADDFNDGVCRGLCDFCWGDISILVGIEPPDEPEHYWGVP